MNTRQDKPKEPRFVGEIELATTAHDRRVLRVRLECARMLYNAVLGDLLANLDQMRRSPEWVATRKLPIGKPRSEAFKALNVRFGVDEAAVYHHPSLQRSCWLREHLDSDTTQNTARDAWKAVARYLFRDKHGHRAGRPQFRRRGELKSVEGKRANRCLRLVKDEAGIRVEWNTKLHQLSMALQINPIDQYHLHILSQPTCYVRIVCKTIRGKKRWHAQLVNAGLPLPGETGTGTVGVDIGPSTLAIVAAGELPRLERLAPSSGGDASQRRCQQRRLDRQRRANNLDNYNPNGTIKPRTQRQPWQTSKHQRKTRVQLAETQRKLAATRRNEHGRLANQVLKVGADIRTEKLSYKAFQRCYGRSVGVRAPGAFIALLKRKSTLTEIPTRTTFLSQRCLCGARLKKDLSLRWHSCDCEYLRGHPVQRDIFSAFLALFCDADGVFNQTAAIADWKKWGANSLPQPLNHKRGSPAAATRQGLSGLAENHRRTQSDSPLQRSATGKASGRAVTHMLKSGSLRNPPASAVGNS